MNEIKIVINFEDGESVSIPIDKAYYVKERLNDILKDEEKNEK